MDWDKLRIFHTVAETGSFTHAGERLGLSQSAVSRQIRGLEESLKLSLFNRHARGLTLTDEGELLFKTSDEVVSKIISTEQQLIEGTDKPRGLLKVTTTISFGSTWLPYHIEDFMNEYPEVDVQLLVSDRDLDLTTREADVAILFHTPAHVELIQKQIALFQHHLYASPYYISRYGKPETLADLDKHRLITFGELPNLPIRNINWILETGTDIPRKPYLQINSIFGVLQAVKAGLGIAALPDYLVQGAAARNVLKILEGAEGREFPAYLVYTAEQRNSQKVKVFRDFIIQKFKNERF
ncbi:MAG: LysR family transcriptional regulator [Kordiimonas sp.]|nr:LysR family transcriptional regulator [Kordiimonas sp.]|tara:strand:- start:2982 stop:3872 length:891 start_codon:yes stop_codon:yes gene_type:complete